MPGTAVRPAAVVDGRPAVVARTSARGVARAVIRSQRPALGPEQVQSVLG